MGAQDQVAAIVAVRESANLLADLPGLEFDALRLPMQRLRLGVVEQRSHVADSEFVEAPAFEDIEHHRNDRRNEPRLPAGAGSIASPGAPIHPQRVGSIGAIRSLTKRSAGRAPDSHLAAATADALIAGVAAS